MENTQTKWSIDPAHSEIAFKVKHLMITDVKGVFNQYEASIYTTGEDFMTSEIDIVIDASSVETRDEKRDKHLRSADFFDVENHTQIRFVGNSYEEIDGDGSYDLYGDLTVKGISKQIKLGVEFGGVVKDPWVAQELLLRLTEKLIVKTGI